MLKCWFSKSGHVELEFHICYHFYASLLLNQEKMRQYILFEIFWTHMSHFSNASTISVLLCWRKSIKKNKKKIIRDIRNSWELTRYLSKLQAYVYRMSKPWLHRIHLSSSLAVYFFYIIIFWKVTENRVVSS